MVIKIYEWEYSFPECQHKSFEICLFSSSVPMSDYCFQQILDILALKTKQKQVTGKHHRQFVKFQFLIVLFAEDLSLEIC